MTNKIMATEGAFVTSSSQIPLQGAENTSNVLQYGQQYNANEDFAIFAVGDKTVGGILDLKEKMNIADSVKGKDSDASSNDARFASKGIIEASKSKSRKQLEEEIAKDQNRKLKQKKMKREAKQQDQRNLNEMSQERRAGLPDDQEMEE